MNVGVVKKLKQHPAAAPKLIQNQMHSESKVFREGLIGVTSPDFPATLILNTQHAHFTPCLPTHHTTPTNAGSLKYLCPA